jgi:hypothetical protein
MSRNYRDHNAVSDSVLPPRETGFWFDLFVDAETCLMRKYRVG